MANFTVKGPDGVTHTVNAPEGSTQQDAIKFVAKTKYGVENEAPSRPMGTQAERRAAGNATRRDGDGDGGPSVMDNVNYLAGGFNKGLMDIADFPATMVNMGLESAGVPRKYQMFEPSNFLDARENFTRVPESIANTNTPILDTARTGLEWGATAAFPSRVIGTRAPDLLAGGGAMIGAISDRLGFTENGELIGGLTGGFGPATVQALRAVPEAVLPVTNAARRLMGREEVVAPQDAASEAALRFIDGNLTGGDIERTGIERQVQDALAAGEKGSLSDLSRNENIAKVEGSAINEASTREALLPVYLDRQKQVMERIDNVAPSIEGVDPVASIREDVKATRETAARLRDTNINRATEADAAVQGQAADAQRVAEQADAGVGGTGRTDQTSAAMLDRVNALDKELYEILDGPVWAQLDAIPTMDTTAVKQQLNAHLQGMPPIQRAKMQREYKQELASLTGLQRDIKPEDLQFLLSELKQKVNDVANTRGGIGTTERNLIGIKNVGDQAFREQGGEAGQLYGAATDLTATRKRMLGGDEVQQARRANPAEFGDKLNFKGNKGATTVERITASGDPELLARSKEYLRDVFRKEGITEGTLTNYAPVLNNRNYADLRAQVEEAVRTGDTAKALSTTAKESTTQLKQSVAANRQRAKQRQKDVGKFTRAKYAATPKAFVKKALNADDDSGELGRLYTRMNRENPEQAAQFKSNVMESLRDDVYAVDPDSLGEAPKVLGKLQRLVDNGILSTDDMKEVSDIIAMQTGRRMRRSGGRIQTPTKLGNMMDDMVSTAAVLPVLSALPSGHQLMAAGMLKRNFKKLLQDRRNDPDIVKQLERMLKSPELYLSALRGEITAESTGPEISKAINGAIRTYMNASDEIESELEN